MPRRPWEEGQSLLDASVSCRRVWEMAYIRPGGVLERLLGAFSTGQSGLPFGSIGILGEHAHRCFHGHRGRDIGCDVF